jgi:hypothetical protein
MAINVDDGAQTLRSQVASHQTSAVYGHLICGISSLGPSAVRLYLLKGLGLKNFDILRFDGCRRQHIQITLETSQAAVWPLYQLTRFTPLTLAQAGLPYVVADAFY